MRVEAGPMLERPMRPVALVVVHQLLPLPPEDGIGGAVGDDGPDRRGRAMAAGRSGVESAGGRAEKE